MIEKFDINIKGVSDVAGDMIYFNPLLFEKMGSNPFRLEERKYPIDFANTFNEHMKLELKIPEGYIVEELPENLTLTLGNNRIVYKYRISEQDGVINFENEMHVNDILFVYDDYHELKELFNGIVDKHGEMSVLKKSVNPVE